MDQTTARRYAKRLTEATGTIHVALTETALRGQWPAADEVWVILPIGAYPHTRAITTLEEAVTKINGGRRARAATHAPDDEPAG